MPLKTITKSSQRFDTKELELPETLFVRDIENRVFQAIVLQCLAKIDGIGLVEGSFIDSILGRSPTDSVKGVFAEQDSKNRSVSIKVEIKVRYGILIPKKAEEIQAKVAEEVTKLTGLHVSCVHVVFKNILHESIRNKQQPVLEVEQCKKDDPQKESSNTEG